jgi:hypothetical protein
MKWYIKDVEGKKKKRGHDPSWNPPTGEAPKEVME